MQKLEYYPAGVLEEEIKSNLSINNLLFGKRIKSSQTIPEYLIEFLITVKSKKKIADVEYLCGFPESDDINDHVVQYQPKAYMGLRRFIFFQNSSVEKRSSVDREAYEKCVEDIKRHITITNDSIDEDTGVFMLQNFLNSFSVENADRAWFTKAILPISYNVLFPEALGERKLRANVKMSDVDNISEVDTKFEFNKYTYMARGGEIYYLHVLHALNSKDNHGYAEVISNGIDKMLNSMPNIGKLSDFIEREWLEEEGIDLRDFTISKKMSAIPLVYSLRDNYTVSELANFLSCQIQPMEKIELFSFGIIIQILRMMFLSASKNTNHGTGAWIIDVNQKSVRDNSEIKKLAIKGFENYEAIIRQFILDGIEVYYPDKDEGFKEKQIKDAKENSIGIFRKLGKEIGMIIPIKGPGMRFTISESVIKFMVMSLVPPECKVTFDKFLDLMYDHFGIVIAEQHYLDAVNQQCFDGTPNIAPFLNDNRSDFAQKLKSCGFLRDLSDATAIVENPYTKEDI